MGLVVLITWCRKKIAMFCGDVFSLAAFICPLKAVISTKGIRPGRPSLYTFENMSFGEPGQSWAQIINIHRIQLDQRLHFQMQTGVIALPLSREPKPTIRVRRHRPRHPWEIQVLEQVSDLSSVEATQSSPNVGCCSNPGANTSTLCCPLHLFNASKLTHSCGCEKSARGRRFFGDQTKVTSEMSPRHMTPCRSTSRQ